MGVVNVLPKNIAELIAAGEVIERPSSVIKELVENCIDAGAKSVAVEIQKGGITYMRVTDDGSGIERDDIKNAFLRHATSKISVQDDLDAIATLGFRGEALASICAVSKVEVITRSSKEQDGSRYVIEGGEEKSLDITGCPQGTTIIVRDIFYNVPARMKFLKKDASEGSAIYVLLERMALSHPEIGFTFIRDGKQIMKTKGDGNLENAIFQVFGKDFYDSLIPVSYNRNNITIRGFVSKPVLSVKANRTMQMFYINGRYVRSKTAAAALEQAYKGSIMVGKYPSCVLLIGMHCSMLDVNVHPAKLEVRFTNERPVFDGVYYAVKNAIMSYDTRNAVEKAQEIRVKNPELLIPPTDRASQLNFYSGSRSSLGAQENINSVKDEDDEPVILVPRITDMDYAILTDKPDNVPADAGGQENKLVYDYNSGKSSYDKVTPMMENAGEIQSAEEDTEEIILNFRNDELKTEESPSSDTQTECDEMPVAIKYIGEVFNTYIILEYDSDRIMLIDKHAAHERLIYERLKKEDRGKNAQFLLSPVSVTLDAEECQAVLESKDILSDTGFDVDGFGEKTILIRSAPVMLRNEDIIESFSEIADYLCKHKKLRISEKMEWIYANTACRAAVKAGNINSREELIELVRRLEENRDVRYCPHGRPIYYFMTKREIEKSFGRIQ